MVRKCNIIPVKCNIHVLYGVYIYLYRVYVNLMSISLFVLWKIFAENTLFILYTSPDIHNNCFLFHFGPFCICLYVICYLPNV